MSATTQSPEAIAALERQLEDPARKADAARALAEAYRAAGDTPKLLSALEALAAAPVDPLEQARALRQAAEVYLVDLKQPDLALTTVARALPLAPGEPELFATARQAAEQAEMLDTYADLLGEVLEKASHSARAALHRELADLQERLGDADAALDHLRLAFEADAHHAGTLETLLRVYRGREQWVALAETLEKASLVLPDRPAQLAALREAASVHELELGDKDRALHCWQEILQREPADRGAALSLERLAAELDRPRELAAALQAQRLGEGPGSRDRDLAVQLAQVKLERLDDPRAALDLCEMVLNQDAAHAAARRLAEACALRPGADGAAALKALDRTWARQGDHEARVALRERRLAGAAADEKLALFTEIRDLCEKHLDQPERAFLAGLKVFAAGADRARLRPELERLAEQTDSLEELAEVFESTTEELMPGDALSAALCRSAAYLRERLGQPAAAAKMWSELLAEVPGDKEALERLARLYESTNDAKGLAEICSRKAKAAADPAERAALLEKAGAAREAAGDADGAIEDFRAALAVRTSAAALAGLDRLLGRARRFGEQADVLAQLITLAVDPAERRALRLRAARLLEKEGRGPSALKLYAAMLGEAGADDDAAAGLERLLDRDDVRLEAARLLEGVWRRSGNARGLAEVLELQVEAAPQGGGALWTEIASLREKLGEHTAAFGARARAFGLRPDDPALRADLERAAQQSGSFDALVGVYEDALEGGAKEPLATELWRRVASLYTDRLQRPELATRALTELSRRSPDDAALLRRLADLHRKADAFRPLVEAIQRLAELEPEAEAKAELLFEAAQVAEDGLADKNLAIACYRKLLERQPDDRNAIKLLERLLGETGQHPALAALLEQDLRLSADDKEEVANLQAWLARLKARELGDPRGAARLLAQALAASPFHRAASELVEELASRDGPAREEAARLLDTMLEGGGDVGKLVAGLEARLAGAPSHSERVVLLRKLALVRARRLNNPDLAFVNAAQALRAAPGDAAALQLCLELSAAAGAQEELKALLEELAPMAIGSATRAALFRALSRLQLHAGEDAAAQKSLQEVLEVAPNDREASEGLEALYQKLGRPREHVALLRRRLSGAREPADRLALLRRIAGLWVDAGDDAAAIDALREALAIEQGRELFLSLERLLGKLGRFEEQAEVLHRLATGAPDPEARALLLRRGAALCAAGQAELAAGTWGQVLARWPGEPEAVAGLEKLLAKATEGEPARKEAARLLEAAYRGKGDMRRYVEMLELRLEGAPAADRAILLVEIAKVREDLGDVNLAFSARRRLFAEAPEDEETREALERLAADAGLLEELLAVYEDTLDRGAGPELALALWRRIAQIRSERLPDRPAAAAAWEEVARRDPKDLAALAALAALWRALADPRRLAEVLARQAELEPTPEARAARLSEAAQIALDARDEAAAARCYQRILELFPDDRRALDALHAILSSGGQHGALAQVVEKEIALAAARGDLEAGLARRLDLARIRLDYLNDAAGAFALWDEALRLAPGHAPALDELEKLALSDDPERARAAAHLEPALEAAGDWARLVRVLEAHAAAAPAERGALLGRAADLCRANLDDPGRAFVLAARALREAPADAALLARCRELAAASGMREELCALLEELAGTAPSGAGRTALFKVLAAEQEKAGDLDEARASWQRVLELEPGDPEANANLETLIARASGWGDLVALLQRRVAATADPQELYALWMRIAEARQKAGDESGAADALRDAFAVSQAPEVLEALEGLLGRARRHLERAEVLGRLAELVADPRRRHGSLVARADALRLAELAEPAMDAYLEAFALGGADDALVAGLEALLEADPTQTRAAALLEDVYRDRGDPARLARVLELQVAPGSPGRAQKLVELARQREALGEARAALSTRLSAFAEAPFDSANLDALDRLARAQGALADFASALRAQAARDDDSAPGWRRLAKLEEELGRAEAAAEAWEKVRRLEPDALDALRALARLVPADGDPKRRAAVLEPLARLEPEPREQLERLLELAALAEGPLADGALAERCYRQVLARDPEHPAAARRLGEVLLKLGNYEELDRLLLSRVDAARQRGDADEAIRCQLELARLQVGPLAAPLAGLGLVREVLAERSAHPGAVAVLEELLGSAGAVRVEAALLLEPLLLAKGDHEGLAEALMVRAEAEPNVFERAELWRRLCELYGGPLGKPQLAFAAASRILRELPDDVAILERCVVFAEAAHARPELIALIEEVAPRAERTPAIAALYRTLADLRGAEASAMPAFEALAAAFRADPDDPALDKRLESAAEGCGAFGGLAGLLEQVLPRLGDPARAVSVGLWLGRLYEEKLAVAERAVVHFDRARAADPAAERLALPALARLYEKLGRWEDLAAALEALAARAEDDEARIALLSKLGGLWQEKLNDPRRAVECHERVLELDGRNLAAMRALEWIHGAAGDHRRLLAVLERERHLVAGAEREEVRLHMAEVCQAHLRDPERAVALYREVLSENWKCAEAVEKLEALLTELGRHEELCALLEERIGRTLERRELAALHVRLAELLWRTLDRPEDAVAHYRAALEREARHEGALAALREIYGTLGRRPELVDVLRRLAAQQEGAAAKATRLQLAELLEGPAGRAEAVEAARAALGQAPHADAELARLRQILVSHQAWPDAAKVLELRAKARLAAADVPGAVEDLFEQAAVWAKAGSPMRGAPMLEQVLDVDPGNRRAWEAAKKLYAQNGQWAPWAKVAARFLPQLEDEAERRAALAELADVQERRLGDPRQAFESACRALQLDPAGAAPLERACALADAAQAHAELARVLAELFERAGRGEAAARLGLRLAEVQDKKLGDFGATADTLRRVLAVDPAELRALDALAALYARRGQHAEHVDALEDKVEVVADPAQKKALLSTIARLREESLRDTAGAVEALRRSIGIAADAETWRELAELQRRRGEWAELVQALLALRDLAAAPAERARLQLEVAGLRERELEDDEAAILDYRAALELDPRSKAALEALERLYARHDRPRELLKVHEKQLALASAPADRVRLLFACSALHEKRLADPARADDCLESVLALEPRNLAAIQGLEALRRAQGRHKDLALVLERHLPLCPTPAEQAALSAQLGELYRDPLADLDRAITCFQRSLALDPKSRPAVRALTGIFEQRGAWPRVAEMLQREAELAGGDEAVALYHRAAGLLAQGPSGAQGARLAYQKALALAPGHLPTLRALQAIFKQEGDWERYGQMLVAEAEHTVEQAAKGKASLEVARHFAGRKDEAAARRWYEATLRLLPESLDAAAPLADMAVARSDWAEAERMLGVVTQQLSQRLARADAGAVAELGRQLRRLGQVCRQGARREEALRALEEAASLEPHRVEVLEDLSSLLTEMARYEDALEVTGRLLARQAGKLPNPAVAALHCRLADLYEKIGDKAPARAELDQALALDPANEPALRARVRLADQAGAWKESVELRGRLAHALKGQARFEANVELGDVARDRLKDPAVAADAYLQALALKPDELPVMDRLAGVYRETRQWHQAVKLISSMLAHPRVLEDQRKRLYLTLGEVAGGEMGDLDRAVAAYDSALDLDPGFQEAFRALEDLLRRRKRHKRLEESYLRQLQRLPETDHTRLARAALWRAMGELRAKELKDRGAALAAYLASAELTPEDARAQEALAAFASQVAGNEDVARTAWRRALPGSEDPAGVCLALGELALRVKDVDSALLALQAFDGLVEGPEHRQRLAQQLPQVPPARPRELLTDRLWQKTLFDPAVRGPVGELMGILVEQAGAELALPHSKFGVAPKKHRLDVGADPAGTPGVADVRRVGRLFAMEESAEVFAPFLSGPTEATLFRGSRPAPDQDVLVEVCPTHPVSLKLGGRFFDAQRPSTENAALVGFFMAFLRPELAVARMLPRERIDALFQAAVSLVEEGFRCTADPKAVAAERKLLKKGLDEPAMVALTTVVRHYLPRAAPDDVTNWLAGAELTAARAALLAAGDVGVFAKVVLDGGLLRVDPRLARRKLLGFVLGGDLHALRVAVGIAP